MFKVVVISLLVGAAATTSAEYFLHYNLFDYVKDFFAVLYHKL